MPRCSSCSAPLPKTGIICNYCGTRNDIDIPAVVDNKSTPLRISERECPNCDINLHSIDVGKNAAFIIDKCPQCFGLFFDNYEMDRLLEESVKHSYWINHSKVHSLLQHPRHKDTVKYKNCPICKEKMQRENYMNHSGVIMDVCRQDGIWLDAGEFKQIQEWLRLGGHNNPSRKILDSKKVLTQQKNYKRAEQNHSAHSSNRSNSELGPDPYLNLISDLFF